MAKRSPQCQRPPGTASSEILELRERVRKIRETTTLIYAAIRLDSEDVRREIDRMSRDLYVCPSYHARQPEFYFAFRS